VVETGEKKIVVFSLLLLSSSVAVKLWQILLARLVSLEMRRAAL
jgi:hypothetical protein